MKTVYVGGRSMGFKIDLPIKRKLTVVFFCSVLKILRSSKFEKRLVYHDQITTSFKNAVSCMLFYHVDNDVMQFAAHEAHG